MVSQLKNANHSGFVKKKQKNQTIKISGNNQSGSTNNTNILPVLMVMVVMIKIVIKLII